MVDDALAGCLGCVVCIGIIWLILHPPSFVVAIIIGIIIYFINIFYKNKKIKEKEILREEKRKKWLEFEKKQKSRGLVNFKDKWGTPQQVKKWKEIDIGLKDNFLNLTPYEFEEFVAKLFRKMGYSAKKTVNTGDFGADIIAKKGGKTILVEVKRYSLGHNITPKEIQRALGALWKHKAEKAVFVTTSDFSVRAKELEKEAPVELWDKSILHDMVKKYFIDNEAVESKSEDNNLKDINGLEDADDYEGEYKIECPYCKYKNNIYLDEESIENICERNSIELRCSSCKEIFGVDESILKSN